MGFAQVGQTEKTSAFVVLSSAVRADVMLSANEQIINFLFYIRLKVRAEGTLNFPPAQSPGRWLLLYPKTIIMKIKLLKFFIVLSVFATACKKDSNHSIDVSKQWKVDNLGLLISGLSDGQWENKTFSAQELNLFKSLDTVDLTGTTMPDSVLEEKPVSHNYAFPNPFKQTTNLSFGFSPRFSGQLVLKYVIVNGDFTVVKKSAIRIQATVCSCPSFSSSSGIIDLLTNIPRGQFRLYYTLSSKGNDHFYRTWGNIEEN